MPISTAWADNLTFYTPSYSWQQLPTYTGLLMGRVIIWGNIQVTNAPGCILDPPTKHHTSYINALLWLVLARRSHFSNNIPPICPIQCAWLLFPAIFQLVWNLFLKWWNVQAILSMYFSQMRKIGSTFKTLTLWKLNQDKYFLKADGTYLLPLAAACCIKFQVKHETIFSTQLR